jgi:hypothetical protein
MRRWALVLVLVGVVFGVAGLILGVTGISIDVPGERTYDCGSSFGRLGGDEAEIRWREDTNLFLIDNAELPRDELPVRACKDATDDRLLIVGVVGGIGAVLVLAGVVAFLLSFRGRGPAPEAAAEPAPEPTA